MITRSIAIFGILLATGVAMFPRWERTWMIDQITSTPEKLSQTLWPENDVVRHFMFTEPKQPANPPPMPPSPYINQAYEVERYTANIQIGRTLVEWFVVAAPFLLIAWLSRHRRFG